MKVSPMHTQKYTFSFPYWSYLPEPAASRDGFASLSQVFERMRVAARRRRAYQDLLSRPDYLLRDIGVSRSEVQQSIRRSRR